MERPLHSAVDRIELLKLSCKLTEPIGNAVRFFDRRDTLLVKITTKDGITGWGETWAQPAAAAALIHSSFGPALLGEDVRFPQRVWRKLTRIIVNDRRGLSHMAISALDMAIWDAAARTEGVPLAAKLGGALRHRLSCYASGPFIKPGPDPYGHYLEAVGGYVDQGFRHVKVRAGIGVREDAELVRRIRGLVGDEVGLMVDFNEAGDVAQAQAFARQTSDCGLVWMEEPVPHDDLPAWRRAAATVPMALAGGESLYGLSGFRDYLAAGVFAVVQPDLALCGGVTEALRIMALAEAFNVPVVPHVWGGAVAFAAGLQFTALLPDRSRPGQRYPFFEYDASINSLRDGLAEFPLVADGMVEVPQLPGLGIEIEDRNIAPFLTERIELRDTAAPQTTRGERL